MSGKEKTGIPRLLEFAGPYRIVLDLSCICSGISSVLMLCPFVCIWLLMRDVLAAFPDLSALETDVMIGYGWSAAALALAGFVVYTVALCLSHFAAFHTARNMKSQVLHHLATLPLGYFTTHPCGALRKTIDDNAGQTEAFLAHQLPDLSGSIVTVVTMLIMLLFFDWRLGVPCILLMVAGFLLQMTMNGEKAMTYMQNYQSSLEKMNNEAVEYVRGMPVVKAFQQTIYSFKSFYGAIMNYRSNVTAYALACQAPMTAFNVVVNAPFAVLILVSIVLLPHEIDPAAFILDLIFYILFIPGCAAMLNRILFAGDYKMVATEAVRRIDGLLSEAPQQKAAVLSHPEGYTISFEDVSFTYPDSEKSTLNHLTFTIPEGRTIAIVGPSGGGKTTVASMIPRFWDVDSGCVRIGGADVRQIAQRDLMDQIAFVFQDTKLLKNSILENIRAARPEATREEVLRAADDAQCNDILEKFPDGVDTILGTKGVYLSGGEQQRLALARAILKDAPIVLLDEATAFADPENEYKIRVAFERLTKGKTVLMIAHRLPTIQNADCIYVMDDGHIMESGTHDELIQKQGLYSRMWEEYQTTLGWKIGKAGGASC